MKTQRLSRDHGALTVKLAVPNRLPDRRSGLSPSQSPSPGFLPRQPRGILPLRRWHCVCSFH